MLMYNNIAIIETITSDNFCFIMKLLTHLDIFDFEDIRTYDMNVVIYKNSKKNKQCLELQLILLIIYLKVS